MVVLCSKTYYSQASEGCQSLRQGISEGPQHQLTHLPGLSGCPDHTILWAAGSAITSALVRVGTCSPTTRRKMPCPKSTSKGTCWMTASIQSRCPYQHHTCWLTRIGWHPCPHLHRDHSVRPTTCSFSGPSACWWLAVQECTLTILTTWLVAQSLHIKAWPPTCILLFYSCS